MKTYQNMGIRFSKTHCYTVITHHNKKKMSWIADRKIPIRGCKSAVLDEISADLSLSDQIILGISHHTCQIQTIAVDQNLSDSEIMRYISSKVPNKAFDYEILKKDNHAQHIKIVSTDKSRIDKYISSFLSKRHHLNVIDLNLFALKRLEKWHKKGKKIHNLPNTITEINSFIALGLALREKQA